MENGDEADGRFVWFEFEDVWGPIFLRVCGRINGSYQLRRTENEEPEVAKSPFPSFARRQTVFVSLLLVVKSISRANDQGGMMVTRLLTLTLLYLLASRDRVYVVVVVYGVPSLPPQTPGCLLSAQNRLCTP